MSEKDPASSLRRRGRRSDVVKALREEIAGAAGKDSTNPPGKRTIDEVPDLLRRHGLHDVAAEWETMQQVLGLYATDEDRFLKDDGEPYGGIPTEAGIKARQHRAAVRRRSARETTGPRRNERIETITEGNGG